MEANRLNKLRVGLKSQPPGSFPRKRHNITVRDHNVQTLTGTGKQNFAPGDGELSDNTEDIFALPQLSARQLNQKQEFIFSFKDKFPKSTR